VRAPSQNEILRLLGTKEADGTLSSLIDFCLHKLEDIARPRCCSIPVSLQWEEGGLRLGEHSVNSRSLSAHIQGCEGAILLAATLGAQVDRFALRASKTDIAQAAVWQACAAAMIEAVCDEYCDRLAARQPAGMYLRPRYSPGYGDYGLEEQSWLLSILQAQKHIGLTLTQGGMLTPTKSVTAVIGVTRQEQSCRIHKCAACDKTDCPFRQED